MSNEDGTLVSLDNRGRISLAKVAEAKNYILRVEPGGTIVLTPAVVMPISTAKSINEFLDDPSKGVRKQRPGREKE